ncbi:MAG: ATP-binding protein [Candidatus Sabulitectum sp.]|nr:ATP-binding protein [Candidatus Sabulitectum sp.]
MLVRFVIDNIYSFGRRTEFNTLPGNLRTLPAHAYAQECGFKLLKLSVLYGANAAGKSNLINALAMFAEMALNNLTADEVTRNKFKLERSEDSDEQLMAVEFIQNDVCFLYATKVINGRIAVEELYLTGKKEDTLVYERTTDQNLVSRIKFSTEFESNEKNMLLKEILLDEFVESDRPILHLLANRDNEQLGMVKTAYIWFAKTLAVLFPESKPATFEQRLETDKGFGNFVQEVVKSYHVGISEVSTANTQLDIFFGKTAEGKKIAGELRNAMEKNPTKILRFEKPTNSSERFLVVQEDDEIWIKVLELKHHTYSDKGVQFSLTEESDGTVKLLNLLPAIYDVIYNKHVYIIDEIERSIHPSLIKELIRKFSHDEKSMGQLIFTTHESVLLDQSIFRQDEIWFAEKDSGGCTDLYPLSKYKEHKTIDIRKGYLEGRYGAIPFLANLRDLKWHDNDPSQ